MFVNYFFPAATLDAVLGGTRIALGRRVVDPGHRASVHLSVSSSGLEPMEIDVAGQTVIMLLVLWLSLQLPLGLAMARALARAGRRN